MHPIVWNMAHRSFFLPCLCVPAAHGLMQPDYEAQHEAQHAQHFPADGDVNPYYTEWPGPGRGEQGQGGGGTAGGQWEGEPQIELVAPEGAEEWQVAALRAAAQAKAAAGGSGSGMGWGGGGAAGAGSKKGGEGSKKRGREGEGDEAKPKAAKIDYGDFDEL